MPCPFFMKAKLNLQAIRVAEKLLKKPFGEFDLSDENTSLTLMYAMVSENNEEVFTKDQFKYILEMRKMRSQIQKAVSDEMAYIDQFKGEVSDNKEKTPYMGDLAALLITFGLDAHFVLYEMKLFEMGDYLKAIDEHKKEQMERDRLWTFYTILPHVDHKKLKKPQDLMPFPWEKEEIEKEALEQLKKDEEMFNKFMKSTI
jgi:hypothetical protein